MAHTIDRSYLLNTSSDHSGLIVVFAAVGVCWSLTVLVTRLSGSLARRHGIALEDWGIVASTGLGLMSCVAVFVAVRLGLGRTHAFDEHKKGGGLAKALYASDILYVAALAFSKLATLRLISVLSPAQQHGRVCRTLAVFTVTWGVAAILVVAIRCGSSTPWMSLTQHQCPSLVGVEPRYGGILLIEWQFARWAAIEAVSLCIECLIFGIAAAMIKSLQMPRKRKGQAMLAFSVRLPYVAHFVPVVVVLTTSGDSVIIPTVLRIYYLQSALRSNNFSLEATSAVIATQCVLHYSMMSASFSYLKPFLAAFDSNFGASTNLVTTVATRSSERHKSTGNVSGAWRSAAERSRGHVERSDATQKRDNSEDSKAPIIFKTTTYQVEVEE